MKIIIWSLIVLLSLSPLAFIGFAKADDLYEVNIVRVVDGDTVIVNVNLGFDIWLLEKSVRINGIDTPESRTTDLKEKEYGLLSKEHLKAMLVNTVVLKSSSEDKYGRILGDFIFEDGTTVSQKMINACMAVAYHGQNKNDIINQHLQNRICLDINIDKAHTE